MVALGFSELEKDATIELINQGIGRAADALARMIKEEVHLSVPNIDFVGFDQLGEHLKTIDSDQPSVIFQHFKGDFSGNALLVFPEECGLLLVRQMLADTSIDENISELEEDALLEIGNIILNACFGQLAELLSTRLDCDIPLFIHTDIAEALEQVKIESKKLCDDQFIMLLQVDFLVQSIEMNGFVAFIMDQNSMDVFKSKVETYLKNLFN